MNGLYGQLSKNISSMDKTVYVKSSMVCISHAIEDIVINFSLKAEMYVLFQEFDFFLFEKERYLKLDQLCQKNVYLCKKYSLR